MESIGPSTPGCSVTQSVRSYTFPLMMLQQSCAVLCAATWAAVYAVSPGGVAGVEVAAGGVDVAVEVAVGVLTGSLTGALERTLHQ
jgi:hypothetical protein